MNSFSIKAVGFYWFSTNLISVAQAKLIRTQAVRKALGIPQVKTVKKEQLPSQKKGFVEGMKESKFTFFNVRSKNLSFVIYSCKALYIL